jgi:hypothetical protein
MTTRKLWLVPEQAGSATALSTDMSTLPARHCTALKSNACSDRSRWTEGARSPSANGPTMPRGSVGRTTSSNCSGGRYNRSVPDHESVRTANSKAVTSERSTEASARPMQTSEKRGNRCVLSGPSMARRAPADSTAAQSLVWPEATAQGTLPNTTADGPWRRSLNRR